MDSIRVLFEIRKERDESLKRTRKLEADYVVQLLKENRELQNKGRRNDSAT